MSTEVSNEFAEAVQKAYDQAMTKDSNELIDRMFYEALSELRKLQAEVKTTEETKAYGAFIHALQLLAAHVRALEIKMENTK